MRSPVPSPSALYRELFSMSLRAVLALFLIPLMVWGFCHHALAQRDAAFLDALEQTFAGAGVAAQQHQDEIALFRAYPPSLACGADDAPPALREQLCEELGHTWQFYWAKQAAGWVALAGAALLLAVAALGLAAFRGRHAQYRSLVLAWRVLALSSALEVVLQSAMLVWPSFWLTAFFFNVYFIKLVALVGIVAAMAAFSAIARIFSRAQGEMAVQGELVPEHDAPALWERIRALAAQLGTAPPDQIVAGIDTNFFVTESPLDLRGQLLRGRTLFVSLPLLRVLDQGEADAVLAHELAHMSGGDTASSAALGPTLVRFDTYCQAMAGPSLTLIAWYLLSLYRVIFELA